MIGSFVLFCQELRDAGRAGVMEDFADEVQAGVKYSGCDGIVTLLGASLQPPRLFLISELMTGESVYGRLDYRSVVLLHGILMVQFSATSFVSAQERKKRPSSLISLTLRLCVN
jgi:hypothetical protein